MRTKLDLTINEYLELTRDNTFDAALKSHCSEGVEQFNYYIDKGISNKIVSETFNLFFRPIDFKVKYVVYKN